MGLRGYVVGQLVGQSRRRYLYSPLLSESFLFLGEERRGKGGSTLRGYPPHPGFQLRRGHGDRIDRGGKQSREGKTKAYRRKIGSEARYIRTRSTHDDHDS